MKHGICLALAVAALTSCAADQAPPTGQPSETKAARAATNTNCPPVETLRQSAGWELGVADYRAQREGDRVIVTASGQHPTAGYQVQLVRQPTKQFPPVLEIRHKAPEGLAAQVISPFTVCASFASPHKLEAVTVVDSKGKHHVPVEPAQ